MWVTSRREATSMGIVVFYYLQGWAYNQFQHVHTAARLFFSLQTCAHSSKVRTYAHSQQGPRHCTHSCRPSTKPQNLFLCFYISYYYLSFSIYISPFYPSLTYIYRVPLRSPLFTKTPYIYCGLIPWAQNILYILQKWFPFTKSALCGSKLRAFDFCTLTPLRQRPLRGAIFTSSKRYFQYLGPRAQQAPNTHLWLVPSHFG